MAPIRPDTTPGPSGSPGPIAASSARPGGAGATAAAPATHGRDGLPPEHRTPPVADPARVIDRRSTFDGLYRDEYDAMVRVAFLLVGNAESAEEIVQDAFITVHLRWSRLETPSAFLRTCVVNGCRDRIRRRVRLRARMPRLVTDAAERSVAVEGGAAGPAPSSTTCSSSCRCGSAPRSSVATSAGGTTPRSPPPSGSAPPPSGPSSTAAWPPSERRSPDERAPRPRP